MWRRSRERPLWHPDRLYLAPFWLAHADVRLLPFKPLELSEADASMVVGTVTMPDGTHAQGVVPLHTLRRAT